jgi:hypothetical protein
MPLICRKPAEFFLNLAKERDGLRSIIGRLSNLSEMQFDHFPVVVAQVRRVDDLDEELPKVVAISLRKPLVLAPSQDFEDPAGSREDSNYVRSTNLITK